MVEPKSFKVEATVCVPVSVYLDARDNQQAEDLAEDIIRLAFKDVGDFVCEEVDLQDMTSYPVDTLDGDEFPERG
jgi:hypothetical protein